MQAISDFILLTRSLTFVMCENTRVRNHLIVKESFEVTTNGNNTGGQLVTNVVIGEDSGFQILSSKDEEVEREKPRKVISTKIHHKKKLKSIHDHRKDDLSQSLEKAKKLLDVKAAIEKLRLRSIESDDGTASEISSTCSETSNSSESDSEIAIAQVTVPKGKRMKSFSVQWPLCTLLVRMRMAQ